MTTRRNFLSSVSAGAGSVLLVNDVLALPVPVVQVAPTSRVRLFFDSTSPFTNDWALATTPSIGTAKILKSTGNSKYHLLLNLPNIGIAGSGKRFLLDSLSLLNIPTTQISDTYNSLKGQCADFAKEMIGSTATTSSWVANTKLGSMTSSQLASLPAGTMIACMTSTAVKGSTYSSKGLHVGIFLSCSYSGSTITGINMVDQNFLLFNVTVGGKTGQCPRSVAKHFLQWNGSSPVMSASQYWTIAI